MFTEASGSGSRENRPPRTAKNLLMVGHIHCSVYDVGVYDPGNCQHHIPVRFV